MSEEIAKTQKALVFEENGGPLNVIDIPVPEPGPNEILVQIKYSGICHSDIHAWKADWDLPTKLPLVGGHEGAGVVVAKGDNVENFEVGELAGIKWINKTCLACEYCNNGNETICPSQEISGFNVDGTFQQYAIADALNAAKIPEGADLAQIAPILCAGITVYKALKETGCKPGDWVVIPGAGGGLGTFAIQYSKAMGFRTIAIDGGAEKGKFCKDLGAEAYVDFMESEVGEEVAEITDGGAHGVVNVSSSAKSLEYLTDCCRPSGTIVLVGIPGDGAELVTPVLTQVMKKLTIKGSIVGDRADASEAIDFYVRGLIKSPVRIVGLADIPMVFDLLMKGKAIGRYVVDLSISGSKLDASRL